MAVLLADLVQTNAAAQIWLGTEKCAKYETRVIL